MANQKISLSINEIYLQLCSECQEKVREIVKGKLVDQAIEQALEGKGKVKKR